MSTRTRGKSAGGVTSLICLAIALWSVSARAEDAVAPPACRAAPVAAGSAASVSDGRTFVLDDGREVRLAGIEIPAADAFAAQAKERLHMLVAGEAVMLGSGEKDRYGRVVAQVFRSGAPERWIQAELVASGHARVAARAGERACTAALLRRERAARNAGLGLWSDPSQASLAAEDPAAVAGERGR